MNKPKEMAQAPPHWAIYFRVPDIDAAAERIKANGGTILNGPMEVPGGDRIVNATGSAGRGLLAAREEDGLTRRRPATVASPKLPPFRRFADVSYR